MKGTTWSAVLGVTLMVGGCVAPPAEEVVVKPQPALENGSFKAEINGLEIHYEVHGSGPVVIAVPNSWGLALDGLRGFYRPLEKHVTMVYFDQRGIGGSAPITDTEDMSMATVRSDFDALRRHLGLDAVHAIGWSNGAMNLILLAAERPETLESAVFLHGAASFDERDMQDWAQRQPELFRDFAGLQTRLEAGEMTDRESTELMKSFWVERFFPSSCADPEAMKPRLAQLYRDVEFSWPHGRYANREAPVFDARDRLRAITARCLIVAGAHDNFPPHKVAELHEGIADSEFVVFESSGHFSPVEEPDEFQRAVLDFWGVP